jgi:Spy/CpxP family protein refolding chaperone
MTRRLIGIGLTVAALSAGAAFVSAQAREQGRDQGVSAAQHGRRGGPQIGRGPGMMGGRGPAMAGRGQGIRGGGFGSGLAALNLTDEQRTKVTDLHRAERDQAVPIHDELQLARKTLQRELFADKRDTGRIRDLSSTIAKFEERLSDLHVKTAMAVADVLTAEQRETMRLRESRNEGPRRGGPRGGGPRGGGPGAGGRGGR